MHLPTSIRHFEVENQGAIRSFLLCVAAAFLIYGLGATVRWSLSRVLSGLWCQHPWIDDMLLKTAIAGMTVGALYVQNIGWNEAGFVPPIGRPPWFWISLATVALSVATGVLLMLEFPRGDYGGVLSLRQRLLWVGFYSSCVEEGFLRGWFQTTIGRILGKSRKGVVVASASVFGLLHAFVYFRGVAGSTTLALVVSTFLLGYLAALMRQRYDSVLPAMVVHVVYNVTAILWGATISFIVTHP